MVPDKSRLLSEVSPVLAVIPAPTPASGWIQSIGWWLALEITEAGTAAYAVLEHRVSRFLVNKQYVVELVAEIPHTVILLFGRRKRQICLGRCSATHSQVVIAKNQDDSLVLLTEPRDHPSERQVVVGIVSSENEPFGIRNLIETPHVLKCIYGYRFVRIVLYEAILADSRHEMNVDVYVAQQQVFH